MNELRCRWVASDQPRVMPSRHVEECADDACRGCQPCPMDHCRVCGIEHASGACPGCVGDVRENLSEIRRMCLNLVIEVRHRGVESEAMVLLGPTVDVEAREHWEASVLAGRLVPPECDARDLDDVRHWLETADDERHPLLVLGTWAMRYRDAFDHEEPMNRTNVFSEAHYLERNLTEAADELWTPFEEFARDVRSCVAHMERVLHDGEQVDRTRVTCNNGDCRKRPRLERKYGWADAPDRWACPACEKVYTEREFREAHAKQLRHEGAMKYLPLREAVSTLIAQGRPERTIRKWLAPPDANGGDMEAVVGGFCEIRSHRVWVWWPDLWRLHLTTKTRNRNGAAA